MEWYCAENTDEAARAVVVVHESGSDMVVGRMIARGLAGQGLHAFMLQLPGYGDRRPKKVSGDSCAPALVGANLSVQPMPPGCALGMIPDKMKFGLLLRKLLNIPAGTGMKVVTPAPKAPTGTFPKSMSGGGET